MKKVYHIVSDASHAWLKVPMAELERLGIAENISDCSYMRNGMAYLEEDADMGVFMAAKQDLGETVSLKEFQRGGTSRIRGYLAYQTEKTIEDFALSVDAMEASQAMNDLMDNPLEALDTLTIVEPAVEAA